MNNSLTSLEKAILEKIGSTARNNHLSIENHIPYLSVISREITGVGMYVYFDDLSPSEIRSAHLTVKDVFSSDHIVETDNLKNGLGYALYAEDGKLKFLELFTYDVETWDGSYTSFSFVEI